MTENNQVEDTTMQPDSTHWEKPTAARKSMLLPVIGSFLIGSLLTAGAIYAFAPTLARYVLSPSPTPTLEASPVPTSTPVPTTTASPVPKKTETIHLPFKNFSTFLVQNCKQVSNGYFGLSMKEIPLSSDFFSAEFTPMLLVSCSNPSDVGSSYLSLAQDSTALYMYGDQSKELGHGGAPIIGKFGQPFPSSDDIETFIFVTPPEACGVTLDGITLRARSIRTMRAADNSPVYLLYEKSIAESGDARLQALYKDFVKKQNPECSPTIALDEIDIDKRALEFVKSLPVTDSIRKNITQVEAGLRSVVAD